MSVVQHPEAQSASKPKESPKGLPFPPLTRSHVLHCSYHYWHPKYRSITPKARLIPLSQPFLDYLGADGIVLPPDNTRPTFADDDSGVYTDSDDEDAEAADPSEEWPEVHARVKETIDELGGKVTPKLNWSAPKDATWINATNDLQCRTPNDIYLLLKSSDFVTHDLEHAFDGCVPDETNDSSISSTSAAGAPAATNESSISPTPNTSIPYHLILRKYINLNPSVEFRCFVRDRQLVAICQRDLNHYDFLFQMRDSLRSTITDFFTKKLKRTFPDPNFVFDVYIPPPHERVWLIDVNPWAIRTDPLLFSWMEILTMSGLNADDAIEEQVVRLKIGGAPGHESGPQQAEEQEQEESESEEDDVEELPFVPEFRLIGRDDPEAYSFSTQQFSAHKLPREVVDASNQGPGGMAEFMGQWQDILAKQVQEDREAGSDGE